MSKNVLQRVKSRRSELPAREVGSTINGIGTSISVKTATRTRTHTTQQRKNMVFCINQLGGVGRGKSQFSSNADGLTCKKEINLLNTFWTSVIYSDRLQKFVAVGGLIRNKHGIHSVMTSTDGFYWKHINIPPTLLNSITWLSITNNDKYFVAVGTNRYDPPNIGEHVVMISTDAINWSPVDEIQPDLLQSEWLTIAHGSGVFISVCGIWDSGIYSVMKSTNAKKWVPIQLLTNLENTYWNGIIYDKNKFVAVGDASEQNNNPCPVMYSISGESWTNGTFQPPSLSKTCWNGITFGEDIFVAVGDITNTNAPYAVMYSISGESWTNGTLDNNSGSANTVLKSVTYGKDIFVAVGNLTEYSSTHYPVLYSDNGIDWVMGSIPSLSIAIDKVTFYTVTYGKNKFIAFGYIIDNDNIKLRRQNTAISITSEDGITWYETPNSNFKYTI